MLSSRSWHGAIRWEQFHGDEKRTWFDVEELFRMVLEETDSEGTA